MLKKISALLLILAMTLGLCGLAMADEAPAREKAVAADGTEFYTTGLPIVDPEQNVEFTVWGVTTASDPQKFAMVKKLYEETGVKLNFIGVSSDGLPERKNLMWASGDYPDILGPGITTEDDIAMYGPMGIILPLNAYIDEYLVNFRENCGGEDVWNAVWGKLAYPDGSIYTYPTVTDYFYMDSTVPSINVTWLKQLGMAIPTTPEEFVAYLKAVKATDLNGNGKHDEIPFTTQNWGDVFEAYAVAGFTGELAGIRYIVDGKVVYPLTSDAVKESAKWLNGLYNEGLIDTEIYTQDENMLKGKAQSADLLYGFSTVWREGNVFGETNAVNYFPMAPLKGEKGTQLWYGTRDKSLVMNQWSVTSACSAPEIVARVVDYMYDPLISLQNNKGPIGIVYEAMEDGTYKEIVPAGFSTVGEWFVDNHFQQVPRLCMGTYKTTNDGKGLEWKDPTIPDEYTFQANGSYLLPDGTQLKGGGQKRVQDLIVGPHVIDAFPPIKNTPEETEELSYITPDLDKYVVESLTRFITGEMNVDTDWDAYVEQINKLGYDRLMEIYQAQYDRFAGAAE